MRVRVGTTAEGFGHWAVELDVEQGTTAEALRSLLSGPPYSLDVSGSTKMLKKAGTAFVTLAAKDKVAREVVLLGFHPRPTPAARQDASPTAPSPVSPSAATAPAAAAPPSHEGASSGPPPEIARMLTNTEKMVLFQRMEQEAASHRQMPPIERRHRSWGRVIAQTVAHLQLHNAVHRGTATRPITIWILGSTNQVEGFLAESGFLHDVNFLDRQPCDVLLVGENIDLGHWGSEEPAQDAPPRIRSVTWDILLRLPVPKPNLNAVLAAGESFSTWFSTRPRSFMAGATRILSPVTVMSTRHRPDEEALARLGEKILHPVARCQFSALCGDPEAEYDDNGWLLAARSLDCLGEVCSAASSSRAPKREAPQDPSYRNSAIFWGIIDLKYDPERPLDERVKVLETGDGRTSRFSNHGEYIPKLFRDRYRLDENASSGKHAVVSANKKLTHDLMEHYGYGHLVPRQACYPRVYEPDLAERIVADLEVALEELVVLKLCNRSRAAGVLPVPAGELDGVLREVLSPPESFQGWMKQKVAAGTAATLQVEWGCYEEQLRHWWSNECPHFVAEQFCTSMLTEISSKNYDGTMRVAFALHRRSQPSAQRKPPPASTGDSKPEAVNPLLEPAPPAEELNVDWIGGYWKLPKEDVESINIRASVISAARTAGTALVEPDHLHEVYAALGDSVQQLFGGSEPSPNMLSERYSQEPELATYLTARLAISMKDLSRVRMGLKLASSVCARAREGPVRRSAESFLNRGYGILEAMTPPFKWTSAREYFAESVEMLPSNAASLYLLGMAELELGRTKEAASLMHRSLILDLDFKAPMVNLGVAYLRMKKNDDAIEVSEACLRRHPESPQCHYHIGVACYQKASHLEAYQRTRSQDLAKELDGLRKRALDELTMSRDSEEGQRLQHRGIRGGPGKTDSPWLDPDDEMVENLRRSRPSSGFANRLPKVELPENIGWRFFGWRN